MTKRRGRGEGSVYQRADGRWFAVVDLGWASGRRIRKTVSAKTKTEALRRYQALRDDLAAGIVSDGSTTVEAWMTYWLDNIAADRVRDSTLRTYRGYVATWVTPNLGAHRLDRLTPEHVRALYAKMRKAGRSDATIRQVDAILGRALRVATTEGKIRRNPCDSIELKAPSGSHGKLTVEEAVKVLRVLAGREDRARWYAALILGMRQSEALGLAWADVDRTAHTIRVRQVQTYASGGVFGLGPPKSRTSRRVLSYRSLPEVIAAFDALTPTDGLVWGPTHTKADYNAWQALLAEAGVNRRPLHAARATTASLLSEFGVSDKVISEIMGHAQVSVTQDRYIHGDDVVREEALGRLAQVMQRAGVPQIVGAANAMSGV